MPDPNLAKRFQDLLKRGFGGQLRKAYADEIEKRVPIEVSRIQTELARHKLHDELITVTASAFLPGGELSRKTGYEFITCEPLVELKGEGCKSFDALIANRTAGNVILVECKTSLANPSQQIVDLYETIDDLEERRSYLEGKVGAQLQRCEYAFCVPAGEFYGLARSLSTKEESGEIDLSTRPPLKIWYVSRFGKSSLSLLTQMKRREERYSQHLDPNLTRILIEGFHFRDEISARCFPSSHPLVKMNEVLVSIFRLRQGDLTWISRQELVQALSDFTVIPHYDIRNLGPRLADELIQHLVGLGLLTPEPENSFALKVKGKAVETVIKQLQKAWIEKMAAVSAEDPAKQAAIDFVLKQYQKLQ